MRSKKAVNKRQSIGGRKGAKNRWANVTPEERSELMRAAARARWGSKKDVPEKNFAASELAKTRWRRLSPEERRKAMEKVRKGRKGPKSKPD